VPSVRIDRPAHEAARPPELAEGDRIVVVGVGFGPCRGDTAGRPPSQVYLVVAQGARSTSVALVRGQEPYGTFSVTLGVPGGFSPGPAELRAQASLNRAARPIALAPITIQR
jgi:hypothetical protein